MRLVGFKIAPVFFFCAVLLGAPLSWSDEGVAVKSACQQGMTQWRERYILPDLQKLADSLDQAVICKEEYNYFVQNAPGGDQDLSLAPGEVNRGQRMPLKSRKQGMALLTRARNNLGGAAQGISRLRAYLDSSSDFPQWITDYKTVVVSIDENAGNSECLRPVINYAANFTRNMEPLLRRIEVNYGNLNVAVKKLTSSSVVDTEAQENAVEKEVFTGPFAALKWRSFDSDIETVGDYKEPVKGSGQCSLDP